MLKTKNLGKYDEIEKAVMRKIKYEGNKSKV